MIDVILFFINPIIFILKAIFSNKFGSKIWLTSLSVAILSIYIPYSWGDSIRYAFKFYEIAYLTFEKSIEYLPWKEPLFYGILLLFSKLRLPYTIFLIFCNFIIVSIIFKIINIKKFSGQRLFYFLLLYSPITFALPYRFILAIYISIYGLLKNKLQRYIFFIFAFLIHRSTITIPLLYLLVSIFYPILKKINTLLISLLIILISQIIFFKLDTIHRFFPTNYLIAKAYYYSTLGLSYFYEMFEYKINYISILLYISFLFSYLYLFTIKSSRKNKLYFYLIILGTFILSLLQFSFIIDRFSGVFNILFVIFIMQYKDKKNYAFKFYKVLRLCYGSGSVIILFYLAIFTNYKLFPSNIPIIFHPTLFQIVGYKNYQNLKIRSIAYFYPNKDELKDDVMVDLEDYDNMDYIKDFDIKN